MAIKTKEEYIESLRGIKRNAFILGKRCDDIVDHPINKPAIYSIAESYAMASEEKSRDIAGAVSHLTGEPVNRYNALNMSTQDLIQRGEMERMIGYRTAAGCPRATGLDAINALYSIAFEIDEKHATEYLPRFKKWLTLMEENDCA
ncbi:MAG: 4-hydroxyphenylacetate 3-hydroxylase N-terminal domain-containing protein, partial [Desulfomonilia bacterium]|nr:4-hydroxyphenylacetate 3-hydroxylase N-terminal domain-containing protein [Desulfomonilia bacterium]